MAEEKAECLTPRQQAHLEGRKLLYDSLKHLTTLSTGSILLLVTFLKEFFTKDREWEPLVAVSLCGFTLSIIGAVLFMIILSGGVFSFREKVELVSTGGKTSFYIALGSFIIGILTLVLFAIKNFYPI